jgi:TRAP-type C4-dicarboxylate transport system substrate-binding protein
MVASRRIPAPARSTLVGAAILLGTMSSALAQQTVTLKFASFEPPQAPFTARAFATWAEDVSKASNGTLKIEMFAGGTLGRNPLQQFKLVQDGVADIAWTVPGYTPGRFDDTEVVELPFIVNNSTEGSLALTRMLAKDQLVGFADLKVLMLGNVPPVSLHGKFPIRTLADLKGKRMRTGSSVGGKITEAMGAVPVLMGAPQTAEAISKGVVDGTLAEWNFVATFKIDEVAQHHMLLPLGGTAVMVPMLKKRYELLPPAARAAIDKFSGEAFARRFAAVGDAQMTAVPAAIDQKGKNTIVRPDAATQDAFKKAVQPVTDEWRKAKPRNERVYQAFVAELAQVRAGK